MGDSHWVYIEFKEKDYPFFKEVLREEICGRMYELEDNCEMLDLADGVYSLDSELSGSTLTDWVEKLRSASLSFTGSLEDSQGYRFNFSCFEGFYQEIEAIQEGSAALIEMKDGELIINEGYRKNAIEYFEIDEDVEEYLRA